MSASLSPKVLRGLYLSHSLSTWNSRMFEFGAVLFLARIFPRTQLFTSIYALVRALGSILLSNSIGAAMDRSNRLTAMRSSIVWQRLPVAFSCAAFLALLRFRDSLATFWVCFPAAIILACVEKLSSVANTVAVERDWIIVIAESTGTPLEEHNAVLRRIDLICKLVAPVFISIIDSYSTIVAITVVMAISTCSSLVEYFAIARVYMALPELSVQHCQSEISMLETEATPKKNCYDWDFGLAEQIRPWRDYCSSPVFLASLSLSMLYLTVLSPGAQHQTYMLSVGYSAIAVSLLRIAAVISELSATCFGPMLMVRIGPIRSGLWSINWQVVWLAVSVAAYVSLVGTPKLAGAGLTAGIVMSRMGLFGFDLSVQQIVQEGTPEASRGRFSTSEMALQNFFELLSFASTIVFPRPEQFQNPVFISYAVIVLSAACFAGFVRKQRGHLLHTSRCVKGREKYHSLAQTELGEMNQGA